MKIERNLTYALLAGTLLLTSCSSEDVANNGEQSLPKGEYPVTITATGLQVTPTSRVTGDDEWTKDDAVAVFCSGVYMTATKKYKASSTGSTVTLVGNDDNGPFYWQDRNDSYAVKAWSCFDGSYTPSAPSRLSVKGDQSGDGYQQSDFLYARGTLDFQGNHSLTFYHQVAKVVVHVLGGDDTPTGMNIGLHTGELYVKCIWEAPIGSDHYGSIGSGETRSSITPLAFDAGEITLPGGSKATPLKSYKFLIVPQSVVLGAQLFSITANGYDPFIYTTDGLQWTAGTEYTYYITIKGSKLSVTTTSSIGWADGGTGTGSVEIE